MTAPYTPGSSGLAADRLTQLGRVLVMLVDSDEVCSSEFLAEYMPRFSVHVHRLRSAGYLVSKRPCDRHDHDAGLWLYKLEAVPSDPDWNSERCPLCSSEVAHTSTCPRRLEGVGPR